MKGLENLSDDELEDARIDCVWAIEDAEQEIVRNRFSLEAINIEIDRRRQ